jgi:competence protein ComEC
MRTSAKITGVALLILFIATVAVWQAALGADHRGTLEVSFLNVGQGSAVLIQAPSGRRVLVDGGPDNSVLRAISARLPWWQRSIDVAISSSPAADSSVGFIDVLGRYAVDTIVYSGISGSDAFSRALQTAIDAAEKRGTNVETAKRGQVIDLGGGAFIEVLSPDRSISGISAADGCVMLRVVYGSNAFLLPCDASLGLQNYIAYLDGTRLRADVLEIPASGAKAVSETLVGYVAPAFAVYSRSCDTSPAQEVVDALAKFGVETHDTCKEKTVTFISDGRNLTRR